MAALTLLSEAAAAMPVLCVVDDLHWADAPSAEVLAFVGRRMGTEPVALLAALRDADKPDGDRLEGDHAAVHMAGVPELHLTGLDPASAAALAGCQVQRRRGGR